MKWHCKVHILGLLPCRPTKKTHSLHLQRCLKGFMKCTQEDTIGRRGSKEPCLRFCLNSERKRSRPSGLDVKEEHFNNHRAWQMIAVSAQDNNSFIRQVLWDWLKDSHCQFTGHEDGVVIDKQATDLGLNSWSAGAAEHTKTSALKWLQKQPRQRNLS